MEGHAAGIVDGFLHGVAGNAALDELVLAELADLEDEAPLAVDSLDDGLVGEDEGARASLREREGREEYDGTGETRVDDTDAERVHQDSLHHFTVQKKEGESVVS